MPIILCDLEGKTRKEAASHLGWPPGTVAGRLAEGRTLLARRLAKHGVAVSAGMLAAVLPQHASSACVPTALVCSTVKAAVAAAGNAVAGSTVPASAAALAEGVVRAMLLTKLKIVTTIVLLLALVGSGVGLLTRGLAAGVSPAPLGTDDQKQEKPGTAGRNTLTLKRLRVDAVDPAKCTIGVSTIKTFKGITLHSLEGVTIVLDGEKGVIKGGVLKLDGATLKILTEVTSAEGKGKGKKGEPAKGETAKGEPGKEEPAKAIAINLEGVQVGEAQGDTTLKGLHVTKDASIVIKGKAAKLSDLKLGMCVTLELGTANDQIIVRSIKAE
jgi:hypothetical protein